MKDYMNDARVAIMNAIDVFTRMRPNSIEELDIVIQELENCKKNIDKALLVAHRQMPPMKEFQENAIKYSKDNFLNLGEIKLITNPKHIVVNNALYEKIDDFIEVIR